MNSNKDIFRYVLMGIFVLLAVGAVIVFATWQSSGGDPNVPQAGPVTVWGTLPATVMQEVIQQTEDVVGGLARTQYVEKDPRTYYAEFLEATALGQGPDLMLVDQTTFYPLLNKISILTFEQYPLQEYRSRFAEGTEVYLYNGVLAIPFAIDPMVMFWNRDMFTNAGISQAPEYWHEVQEHTELLTRTDDNFNVMKSTIAFGEARNVTNFKEIVSALMMQVNVPITYWNKETLDSLLVGGTNQNGAEALRFYTDFANPTKLVYSWNRSLPSSRDHFVAGDSAMYVGFASEANTLVRLNPNLNFDVALLPQIQGTQLRKTYGRVYAFVIPTASDNRGGAFNAAMTLTSQFAQNDMMTRTRLATVRRDLLAARQTTTYWDVLFRSAVIAKTWIDPDYENTNRSFQRMIETVQSGEATPQTAARKAQSEISNYSR